MKTPACSSLTLLASALVAATLCLSVSGCGKKADTGNGSPDTSNGSKRKVVIGFIGKSLSNDVFQAAEAGARAAAADAGAKYGVDVELEVRTPNDEDATKQAEAVEALSRRGADGIALSCSEANTVTPSIDQAVDKGTQVVCFDSDAPREQAVCLLRHGRPFLRSPGARRTRQGHGRKGQHRHPSPAIKARRIFRPAWRR